MIYAKFYCNAEISCSVNIQRNEFYLITINLCIAMKLYINHLEYLKYLYKRIEIFIDCHYFLIIFPLKPILIIEIFDPNSKPILNFFILLLNAI